MQGPGTAAFWFGTIPVVIRWLLNAMAFLHPYGTEWVEDPPEEIRRNTVYVVGGREHPFQAGVACPRKRCKHVIYLDIAPEITRRWSLTEHDDGRVSLSPSVHVTGLPCRCHYWIKRGRICWSEAPRLRVPRENRRDPQGNH